MERDELIQFLKDNLTVDCDIDYEAYSCNRYLNIRLKLNGDTFSETYLSLPEDD